MTKYVINTKVGTGMQFENKTHISIINECIAL